MKRTIVNLVMLALMLASLFVGRASAFEGRITAVATRDGQAEPLVYTVGTNTLRIEIAGTAGFANAIDLFDLHSSAFTILFPNNHSVMHLTDDANNTVAPQSSPNPPAVPVIPTSPVPNVPIAPVSPVVDANRSAMAHPGIGGMRMMIPQEKIEIAATGQTTNLLGYKCARYELKQRGETFEVWATDQLLPFKAYIANQPHRSGPNLIEERWGEALTARKLFPLLAVLRFENGGERLRFEVKSIKAEKLTDDDEAILKTPSGYQEIQPLPF